MAHDLPVVRNKTDRFGREVCKVWVQPSDCPRCGKTLDVGLAQISVGLAWWFRRYADEQWTIRKRGGGSPLTEAGIVGGREAGLTVGVAEEDEPRVTLGHRLVTSV